MSSVRIGVDIGGTNTDIVVAGDDLDTYKTPTTPHPSDGVLTGIEKAATDRGTDIDDLLARTETLIHGTTVTTNALLEGSEATTGLLTTAGFRDLLEHNFEPAEELYALRKERSGAVPPRYLRRPVNERIDRDGSVRTAIDETDVISQVERLLDEGVEAIAVALMNSHFNTAHEEAIKDIADDYNEIAWTFSVDVLSSIGLYDRAMTAVVDASLKPLMREYLTDLEGRLQDSGFEGTLLIMQGNGGVSPVATMKREPITSVNSGPAAGTIAVARLIEDVGVRNAISFDMGGTSSDACLLRDQDPIVADDGTVGDTRLPIPMVDIDTIGAGGGSIAWIDDRGILRIGPESAGSDPGPVCYGNGGERPTVTDANLLLGYLNPDFFLGGEKSLDVSGARRAVERNLADPLGMTTDEVAAGIYDLANEELINQLRQMSINRGHDPREFVFVAFGGAAGLHAAALARRFDTEVLVPSVAGTFSALGLIQSNIKHDFVRSCVERLSSNTLGEINDLLGAMESEARQLLEEEEIDRERWRFERTLETRYAGQVHEIDVPVPDRIDEVETISERHHDTHEQRYAFRDEESEIEVINARLSAIAETDTISPTVQDVVRPTDTVKAHREVYFSESGVVETPTYGMDRPISGSIAGPGILEGEHTTIVIPPDFRAEANSGSYYRLAAK